MNRPSPLVSASSKTFVEALEPRIAPAGLNETKFTSTAVGTPLLLDASGLPGDSQGLSTAFGAYAGSYLLYLVHGKAEIFTTDINGNGVLDPGEITGIALAPDSLGRAPQLILFSDVKGDIVTNLQPGHGNYNLTDSDNIPTNGRDGRVLLGTNIDNITTRTLTASDIDLTVPGNTVNNRLALTHFSIYGKIISGGDFGGLTIDNSGQSLLQAKFNGTTGISTSGSEITVNGIYTGTAANYQYFHFTDNAPQVLAGSTNGSTELVNTNIEGQINPYQIAAGMHGGDISNVKALSATTAFSVGVIASGSGGTGARGGDITGVSLHSNVGGYSILSGNGGDGPSGGRGGNITGFSDTLTIAGQSLIHTGNGGRGTLGNGGDGGIATFSTLTNASDIQVVLGAGGSGFVKGGNGAGLTSTLFTSPDVTIPLGGKAVGTWHDIGDVGNTHPIGVNANGQAIYSPQVIDFDGDGFGDAVFATSNPDQLVIVFGDGTGNIVDKLTDTTNPAKTIVLKTPGDGTPVFTVGDFNGDGRPDIAVASNSANNFGGINVYLNQIQDAVLNPINANNYTHNPLGDHPFSDALHTGIPTLNINNAYLIRNAPILSMAAGDFNGDGITDIAYSQIAQPRGSITVGQVVSILFGDQATSLNSDPTRLGAHLSTTFVNGSLDNGLINNRTGRPEGTGFFYANATAVNGVSGVQLSDFVANTGPSILRASSLTNNNLPTTTPAAGQTSGLPVQPETIFRLLQATNGVEYFSVTTNPVTHIPTAAPFGAASSLNAGALDFGYVDTNRLLGGINISPQRVTAQDFQIADFDQDGGLDLIGLSLNPTTYLATFHGVVSTAANTVAFQSTSGNVFGQDNGGISLDPTGSAPQALALAISDPLGSGRFNGFAVENLITSGTTASQVREFVLTDLTSSANLVDTVTYNSLTPTIDRAVNALDTFYTSVPIFDPATGAGTSNLHPAPGYIILAPDISDVPNARVFILSRTLGATARYLTENGVNAYSGNGGDSSNGVGGNAGAIGDGTLSIGTEDTTTASIQIRYTLTPAYRGTSLLQGGNGGNGFRGGGLGGDISGVSTRYNDTGNGDVLSLTSLFTGNGGNGISGDGGRGGDIAHVSIENGPSFSTGNGGRGANGGRGGSILGNQTGYDTYNPEVSLLTGNGGQGSTAGGAGGTISRWNSAIPGLGGDLTYVTGNGGSAAAGGGGAGGGILDSPLSSDIDLLSGILALTTGAGGGGLIGGTGGNITNFLNRATDTLAIPTAMIVLAGPGGVSVSGTGGTGGSITNFQSNAIGITSAVSTGAIQSYNGLVRILAGNGGESYGGQGGDGGNLTSINATATSTPLIAAGGAGGNGLTVGGTGGSVSNSVLNSAATQIGKLLIVGGKGGDAYAAQRADIVIASDPGNTNDLAHALLAFGGTSGTGGNGGSVTNITQPASVQTAVDIIAGNGGNTVNASTASTPNTGVGQGGSVNGIVLTGTLGSLRRDTTLGQTATPPIKSYSATDPSTGVTTSTVSGFVDFLRTFNSAQYVLDDNSGNVGMVAGAAGTVRGGQPAQNGVNGQVNGVSAASILSIVAGSVDQVAPVSVLSGIRITNPDGELGADKSPNAPYGPNGRLDYYNELGINVAQLRSGYRLIDGAIFYQTLVPTAGQPIVSPRLIQAGSS